MDLIDQMGDLIRQQVAAFTGKAVGREAVK
jgi:hypothetical protein